MGNPVMAVAAALSNFYKSQDYLVVDKKVHFSLIQV